MENNSKPECPACESDNCVCNGHSRGERQSYRCNDCGRRFLLNGAEPPLRYDTEQKVDILMQRFPNGTDDRRSNLSISELSKQTGIRRATLSVWFQDSRLIQLLHQKLEPA